MSLMQAAPFTFNTLHADWTVLAALKLLHALITSTQQRCYVADAGNGAVYFQGYLAGKGW
jgi:hypothetical protein